MSFSTGLLIVIGIFLWGMACSGVGLYGYFRRNWSWIVLGLCFAFAGPIGWGVVIAFLLSAILGN